jgi:hypothetical protein
MLELDDNEFISITTDGWSSRDGAHSLLSLTAHFICRNGGPKFVVLAARPIKGMVKRF